MKITEQLKELGYKLEKEDKASSLWIYLVSPDGNNKIKLGYSKENKIHITASDPEIITTGYEIYNELYTPAEILQMIYDKLDSRSAEYITELQNKIKLVNRTVIYATIGQNMITSDNAEFIKKTNYKNNPDLYKIENYYVLAYSYETIDDITQHFDVFSEYPTEYMWNTANLIDDILFDVLMGKIKMEFNCYECGKHIHWLDISGDLQQKYHYATEKFCGNCDFV